ncbi:MAG: hypothetical protein CVU39_01440 [Chloroflexi bacterium HGW-Chloroflexi-10]|nr:MAG: hypothetical protein CVU39_01440 [Chloroflexi bacterium HGW-Chloroflexi-10]
MIKPAFVLPGEKLQQVGRIFGAPLVVKGKTWLPFVQLIAWPITAWIAKKRLPQRSWWQALGVGVLTMPVMLAAEWTHNLAHAAAARLVGKPVDAIRITWGMPLLIYYDINDAMVTPRQHIFRAVGGPVWNTLLLSLAMVFKRFTKPQSVMRDMANTAVGTNAFIGLVALLPIPGIDGGPILKWSLVERGRTPAQADEVVRRVNGVLGIVLAIAGILFFKKRRWFMGGIMLEFAAIASSIGLGILKEQK